MIDVLVHGSDFVAPFAFVNGLATLHPTVPDLVRSALTCGHLPPGNFWPYMGYRRHAAIWRTSIVRAHVSADTDLNALVPTDDYWMLEATERGFVSSILGSAVTHLVAQQRLGFPVLLHLSTYGAAFNVVFNGRHRPDFIAPFGATDWAVIEAKGRARLRPALVGHAKTQTRSVTSIAGAEPRVRVVAACVFRKTGLEVELHDPPAKSIALQATVSDVVSEYYLGIKSLLDEDGGGDVIAIADRRFRSSYVRELDLVVGLDVEIEAALAAVDQREQVIGLASTVPLGSSRARQDDSVQSIGPDGVLVRLGDTWLQ